MSKEANQRSTFIRKEYVQIEGAKRIAFFILVLLFGVSFFALTLAKGSLEYLEEKMDNPFTSWISINVNNSENYEKYDEVKQYFTKCQDENKFSIEGLTGSYKEVWTFWKLDEPGVEYVFVNTFSRYKDSLLLENILEPSNVITSFSNSFEPRDFQDGVIVSKRFAEDLAKKELSDNELEDIFKDKKLIIKNAYQYPVRILAVVKSLPQKANVICEHVLAMAMGSGIESDNSLHPLNTDPLNSIALLVQADDEFRDEHQEFTLWLKKEFEGLIQEYGSYISDVTYEEITEFASHNVRVNIGLARPINSISILKNLNERFEDRSMYEQFYIINPICESKTSYPFPNANYEFGTGEDFPNYSNLSLKFSNLGEVANFQGDLQQKFKIELDLDQVEAKNNFHIISLIAKIMVIVIVLLSVFAIVIYIYNMLKSHLEKIKPNLGTLMAFGMSKKYLQDIYIRIIFRLMLRACALTFLILIGIQLIFTLIPHDEESTMSTIISNFNVFTNHWLIVALLVMGITTFLFFRRTLKNFLTLSPGDLIYNR